MVVAPNQKKLIIPGKTDPNAPLYYARDMRTIEQWANALQTGGGGGITEITSSDGSVTITDPTGPTTDLSVAANAGVQMGEFIFRHVGPQNFGLDPVAGAMYFSDNGFDGNGTSILPLLAQKTPATLPGQIDQTFGIGWMGYVAAGASGLQWPELVAPPFTNATFITVSNLVLSMTSVTSETDLGDLQLWQGWAVSPVLTLSSAQTYQTVDTDFTQIQGFGSDISVVAGNGPGTGLVSASGAYMYFGSVVGSINYLDATF